MIWYVHIIILKKKLHFEKRLDENHIKMTLRNKKRKNNVSFSVVNVKEERKIIHKCGIVKMGENVYESKSMSVRD